MKLTILGSGTCVPSLERSAPGYFLEVDEKKILIDCGSGTVRRLLEAGIDYKNIDVICLTHFHPDHFIDVVALLHAINYAHVSGFKRTKELVILGPEGAKEFFDNIIFKIAGTKPWKDPYKIRIEEVKEKIVLDKLEIKTAETDHFKNTAFRFNFNNKSLTYFGDTGYNENIVNLSKNSDLLILECSTIKAVEGHLNPELCGKIASQAKVKQLVLTHFYPEMDKINIKNEVSKYFDGEIIIAKDLMKITL